MLKKITIPLLLLLLLGNCSYAQQKPIKTEEDLAQIEKTRNNYEIIIIGTYKAEHFKSNGVIYVGEKIVPIYPDDTTIEKIGDISKYDGKVIELHGLLEYLPERPMNQLRGHWIKRIDSIKEIQEKNE